MMKMNRALAALGLVCAVGGAQAAFVSKTVNGGAVVYDDVNNVTWLQNWNMPAPDNTDNYNTGYMIGAKTWDDAHAWAADLTFAGADDWRLPNYSEYQMIWPAQTHVGVAGLNALGFSNVQHGWYWLNEEYDYANGYRFFTQVEDFRLNGKLFSNFVVAVRSGDIAPVPVPATLPLLIAGLAALGAAVGRRKSVAVQP